MGLISLQEAKEHLGIVSTADDPRVTDLIAEASGDMEAFTGRHLESYARTEYLDGQGGYKLFLSEPAESVTSVHQDSDQSWTAASLVAAADYMVRGHIIERLDATWSTSQLNVRVIYKAGFTTIPSRLKGLCKTEVARRYSEWQRAKAGKDIVDNERQENWTLAFKASAMLAPEVQEGLRQYYMAPGM